MALEVNAENINALRALLRADVAGRHALGEKRRGKP